MKVDELLIPSSQRIVQKQSVLRKGNLVIFGVLIVFSVLVMSWNPAVAHAFDSNTKVASANLISATKTSIVIDGRPIFQIEPSGPFSSAQRAKQANRQLAMLANLAKETTVEVVERNQQPTIVANGQYLLTVTDLDATLDKTSFEQAQEWSSQLDLSLRQARLEREPAYVRSAAWLMGLTLLIAVSLHWGLGYFWRHPLKRTVRQAIPNIPKTGMPGAQDFHFLMDLKLSLVRLLVWLSAAWYVSSLFPTLRQRRYDLLHNSATGIRAPIFSLGEQSYTIADVLILLGLLWGLFTLVQVSVNFLKSQILRRLRLARGAQEVVLQTYRYAALMIGGLIVLQAWGIDLGSLALLGSALGLGLGFGLQDIAKNFGSGLVLLFERSIQVGDFIELDPHMGVVERIGARSITLRNPDNISILVPNAQLIDSKVMNWNHDYPTSRLRLGIGVAYGTNSKVVRSALLQVAQEHSEVLSQPAPDVYLREFGDNAIEFDLLVWIRHPELQLAIRSDIYFRLEELLSQQGISIPYPQRDLHLRSGNFPITFSPEITEALLTIVNSGKFS